MKTKAIVKTVWRWVTAGEDLAAILALLIMVGLVDLAIVLRLAIQFESSAWEEVARFSSLWMYFFGVAVASKEHSHLRMGFLEGRIRSARTKLAMAMAIDFTSLLCLCIFTWWSTGYLIWSIGVGEASLVLMVGMWVVHSAFVVGSFLASIHMLLHFINSTRTFLDFGRSVK